MRFMLLSAAVALGALAVLPGAESVAQAQSRRGGPSVQFSTPRGSVYYGPSRYYDSSRYYERPRSYYDDRYDYSTPRYHSYSYQPRYSYSYSSYSPSRYHYYWSGGHYICFDRHTGAYWYQQGGWWYRWH